MAQRKLSLVFCLILLSISCKESVPIDKKQLGQEYNPLQLNATWTYQGDSTIYDSFSSDTIHVSYFIKDSIVELQLNNEDTLATLERSISYSLNGPFLFQQTYSVRKSKSQYIPAVNGLAICTMVYPIQLAMEWNGNQYNVLGDQTFTLFEITNTLFQNQLIESVGVIQQNNKNLIREDFEQSIFGKDIGMLSYKLIAVDKDISSSAITAGNIVTLSLINYSY